MTWHDHLRRSITFKKQTLSLNFLVALQLPVEFWMCYRLKTSSQKLSQPEVLSSKISCLIGLCSIFFPDCQTTIGARWQWSDPAQTWSKRGVSSKEAVAVGLQRNYWGVWASSVLLALKALLATDIEIDLLTLKAIRSKSRNILHKISYHLLKLQ